VSELVRHSFSEGGWLIFSSFYWIFIEKTAKMWYNTHRIGGGDARRTKNKGAKQAPNGSEGI
jgi:hypothetical protein